MRQEQSPDAHEWLPLDTARDAFQRLVTGPDPLSVDGHRFAGLPKRRVPLDELRDRLMSKQCPTRTRDQVWAHLVERSRRDGATWTVACVGTALPALAGSARWLAARYRGDRADVHAAVLAGFIEALTTVGLEDPGIVVRLSWAVRRAGQAALEESLDAPSPVESGFRSAVPRPPDGHPDLVLARAVGDGVLTPTEAELISATRLGDTTVTAWARDHDAGLKAAFKARDRAEDRLVSWLREQSDWADSVDPVADAALSSLTAATAAEPDIRPTDVSLSVSGRRRNGRPVSSRSVSKSGVDSGLLEHGETPSRSSRSADSQSTPEDRRCA